MALEDLKVKFEEKSNGDLILAENINELKNTHNSSVDKIGDLDTKLSNNTLAIEINGEGIINAICGSDDSMFTSGQILPNGEIELTFNY